MANAERANVNQRLYYAKLLLEAQRQKLDEQELPRHVAERAFGEAAVLHLILAYRRYLSELAVAYQLAGGEFDTARSLARTLEAEGAESGECAELLALERGPSWLSSLLGAYLCLGGPESTRLAGYDASVISTINSDDSQFSFEHLESAFQALQAVIESQRARLEEW